jgi:predicted nuclease of predicted toxin-antitoxin system
MRFLADESCDFAVVRALQAGGHDVLAVASISPRAQDNDVMLAALRDDRVLLTEDKDFGQLFYARGQATSGVIFVRFPALARAELPKVVSRLVEEMGERLKGRFVVVQPHRIRIGRTPRV